jgi:hypothetical protein
VQQPVFDTFLRRHASRGPSKESPEMRQKIQAFFFMDGFHNFRLEIEETELNPNQPTISLNIVYGR